MLGAGVVGDADVIRGDAMHLVLAVATACLARKGSAHRLLTPGAEPFLFPSSRCKRGLYRCPTGSRRAKLAIGGQMALEIERNSWLLMTDGKTLSLGACEFAMG
jgi:hypothetical protein